MDHQIDVMENKCKLRKNPRKCKKYFRSLVEKGKDVQKIFKFQKLKKEQCKSKKCKKRKKQSDKKLKKKLQAKNKKTSNGPRIRSAKKGIT